MAGFPLELECLDDGQGTERQNCELERENGGECCWSEKAARDGAGTVVETLAQDWSSMNRECNMNVLVAIRDRMLSWAGHVARMDYTEICAKALRCRGLQWWRWRQLHWKEVEKDKMVWPTPTAVQNLQVGGHGCWGSFQICWKRGWSVEDCPRQHGLVALFSKPWKLEAIFEMWKESCIDDPGCLGDPCASGMVEASMVASMALMASRASVVALMASMALLVALLDSRVSVVAPLDRLRLMAEPKSGAERVDGLSRKICEERADGLRHKICEERADELTIKIDGERVGRFTLKNREERVDGLFNF